MKKKYYEHVLNMLNFEEVRWVCTAEFADFSKYATLMMAENEKKRHFFKDNDSSVLAVAHLDSVQSIKGCEILKHPAGWRIYSPALDDRLGVYVILCLLPKLGIFPDILLTDNEEGGGTTSEFFETKKKYNWMFSFDRTGADVVMYQYRDEKVVSLLKEYDLEPGYGSFSCIGKLEHLGCKGFNFGVGYHDYHSEYAYAKIGELVSQVTKFSRFFHGLRKTHLKHEKKVATVTYSGRSPYAYEEDDFYKCGHCEVISCDEWKCPNCQFFRRDFAKNYT